MTDKSNYDEAEKEFEKWFERYLKMVEPPDLDNDEKEANRAFLITGKDDFKQAFSAGYQKASEKDRATVGMMINIGKQNRSKDIFRALDKILHINNPEELERYREIKKEFLGE